MRTIDNIVIGSTFSAARYAKNNNFPILLTTPHRYFFFDFGLEKRKINILLNHYILGDVLNHNPVEQISIDKSVLTYFDGYREKALEFEQLHVFDFVNISCKDFKASIKESFYKIADWANFKTGGMHEHNYIYVGDRTMYEVHFFPSKRMDIRSFKDAVAVSYLTEEELDDPNLNDSIMRLRLQQVINEQGIRGSKKGATERYDAKFEIGDREKIKIIDYQVSVPDNIQYFSSYIDEVIDERTKAVLIEEGLLSGRDNTDSQTAI